MKRQLKKSTPKNYSFLDLVAPSYNRVKIMPKFVEGGGTPIKMTEPTMFMPPQSLNSSQPALLNSANEFDWNKQRLIDPGNAAWNEHKKLYPKHKDGSKYHEYFLCNLNPDMCGGPNPKYRTLRTSENPEIQQLIKELDPLFDEYWKDPDKGNYTLEEALGRRISTYYNRGIGEDIKKILNTYKDKNITEEQKQKLKRLYDLALQDSGNEIVKNPNPTNFYNEYLVNWKSPSQWNYQNKASKFYNDQEAFATGMDAWNNRNLNTDTVPNIQAPVVNTPTPVTPKVNPINLPQVQFPNMQSSNLEPLDDTRNASLRDFNPFGIPQITPQVPNTIATNKTTYPITLPNSPLNPNYKPPVNSGFSMTNPYDSNSSYAGDWLSRFKERERNNNPELSQDEIDRITAEDNALNNIIDSNYGFNSSSMPRVNENISSNQLANLPNQNQWSNLQEPLSVQRPYEYADPQQAIIGSIKNDFKPADTVNTTPEAITTKKDSTEGFNYKRAARLGAFNAGLNLTGGMYNMSRMRNQENLNSFITQQPEAIYPNKRMLYGDKSMFAEMGGEYSEGGMYPDGGSVYNPDAYVGQLVQYKKGGIYIKPENKGKFTAWASSHGMSVQEAASHVMANKEKYSSTTVKRANFAKNASKWKKEKGGEVDNDKEMVDGVADILSRVNDVENRKELARYMTNQFNDENVDYDYDQFLAATNLMEMAYGGHYIPQDVNYIGGRFIPNRVDLQEFKKGGMIKRADGSYSQRGLWDNIRANKGSGKKPTKEMLKQERKIKKGYKAGGEYMEGNEYEISGEELDRLRSLGYDIEMI